MTLEALTDTDKIALAADWMELSALLSFRQTCSSADLVRSLSVLEEPDHEVIDLVIIIDSEDTAEEEEEEILQSQSELWVSDVREELATRQVMLGESYPFKVSSSASSWRLTYDGDSERHDHLFYSCCLLITGRRYRLVTRELPEMDKILQIIAYLVAARVVEGSAYWFGYPRPDNTTKMADAVMELLNRIGFDSPILTPPMWSIGKENDGGIDVVAWKNFCDDLPARLVLYGQVASGKNWESKPVMQYTETTWPSWVGDYGQKWYIPAMFIPWQQYVEVESTRDRGFRQRVLELSVMKEKMLGLTIDRGRIAELATKSTRTGNGDEDAWIAHLIEWRINALQSLRE